MIHWFYAVIVESNGWFNTAVRARDLSGAQRILAKRYLHGTIHSITL